MEQEKAFQKVQAAVQAVLSLRTYDPPDLIVLGWSLAGRNAVRNLWQTPISDSQNTLLGFWRKALLLSADNYSHLKVSSRSQYP